MFSAGTVVALGEYRYGIGRPFQQDPPGFNAVGFISEHDEAKRRYSVRMFNGSDFSGPEADLHRWNPRSLALPQKFENDARVAHKAIPSMRWHVQAFAPFSNTPYLCYSVDGRFQFFGADDLVPHLSPGDRVTYQKHSFCVKAITAVPRAGGFDVSYELRGSAGSIRSVSDQQLFREESASSVIAQFAKPPTPTPQPAPTTPVPSVNPDAYCESCGGTVSRHRILCPIVNPWKVELPKIVETIAEARQRMAVAAKLWHRIGHAPCLLGHAADVTRDGYTHPIDFDGEPRTVKTTEADWRNTPVRDFEKRAVALAICPACGAPTFNRSKRCDRHERKHAK